MPRVALVGRPNVGKSTLFNRLVGDERSVTHDTPGTTRDAIDTVVETPEGTVCFVDTAGMRRKSRTERGTEYFSVVRALEALDRADIALLVIDATAGVTHQDQRLAERIGASGCPTVVVLNKWELVATDDRPGHPGRRRRPPGLPGRRAGTQGQRLDRARGPPHPPGGGVPPRRPTIRRIPTGELNRALKSIQMAHPPVGARIRYAVQGANDPPTFTLFTNGRLQPTYLRYVERGLRERFEFGPTPIKLRVRAEGAPGRGPRSRRRCQVRLHGLPDDVGVRSIARSEKE